MVTLNILEDRLIEFPGAILLVTHDRYFMHRVATQILAIDQKHDPGHVESFSTLEQWEAWQKEQASSKSDSSKAEKKSQSSKPSQDSNKENNKESKKKIQLTYNEQRELDLMESKIQKAEKEIETLSSDETPKSAEVYKQIGEIQKEVETLYARWAELEQKKP
jgi:ATP-binding cassette subfamily F protein uup